MPTILETTSTVGTGASFGRGGQPPAIEFTGQTFEAVDDYLDAATFYIANHASQRTTLDYRFLITTVVEDANGTHPGTVLFESAKLRAPELPAAPYVAVTIDTGHLKLVEGQKYAFVLDALSDGLGSDGFVLQMSYWGAEGGTDFAGGHMLAWNANLASTRAQNFNQDWYDYDGTEYFNERADLAFKLTFESNKPPSNIALSANKAAELSANAALIGNVSAFDLDSPTSLTFQLINNAGGRFKLVGTKLMVADGTLLDFEQATSHQIQLRVTDADGLSAVKAFTINVTNKNPESAIGDARANTFVGGSLGDRLTGNSGNDILKGGAGNDKITGGIGADKLNGGANDDTFVFNVALTAANRDTIYDFNIGNDKIQLENAFFTKVGTAGALKAAAFKLSTATKDTDDRIIYNKTTGQLFYDSDGSGAAAAVHFATLQNKPTVTAVDFQVI